MKILLISHARNDENAGASRVYHLLAEALRGRGHQVTLYHYDDLRVPRVLDYLVPRLALPQFIYWRFIKEAVRDYDLVCCSNGMGYPLFRKLKEQAKPPVLVHHVHGLSYFDHEAVATEKARGHLKLPLIVSALKGRFPIKWDAEGARLADVILVQNLRDQDYLEDRRQADPQRQGGTAPIIRVCAALHPEIEAASAVASPPEKRAPASILWFGSWVERKGNFYVNRAFREIKARFPEATLTLGGTGCKREVIESFFEPELRPSIRVLPRINVEDQIREFNSHALFIFPSLSEGFGLALIEAMAMGVACVATETGMVSDWVEDYQHALIVAKASSIHLARGVCKLIEDQPLRHHIARTGQKLARQFTVERSTGEYLAAFEGWRAPMES